MPQLALTRDEYRTLWDHLLREGEDEQCAFVLATSNGLLEPSHIVLVPDTGFAYKSRFGFELTDEFRSLMIKEAHDRNAIIVEFHSHPFPRPARFSLTDLEGLREFVPHVRWRLKGKPYGAVVVAPNSFDSFFWQADDPEPLTITVAGTTLLPTRKSEW